MRRDRLMMSAIAAALVSAGGLEGVVATARGDIIVNGGFETGNLSGWSTQGAGVQVATFAHTGRFSVMFTSHDLLVNQISQQVSDQLVPGQMYRIDFWVYNVGVGDDQLSVGVGLANLFHQTPVSTPLEQWALVSYTFQQAEVFNDPFGIICFDDHSAVFVDDVSITLVPTPGAAGALGLAGVFAARRRRP